MTDKTEMPANRHSQAMRPGILSRLFEKYSDYVDAIPFIVSIWATLVIFGLYNDSFPEMGWPLHLDELVWFILLFILCLITSSLLRVPMMIGIVAGLIWGAGFLAIDLYEDLRDPRKTSRSISLQTEGSIVDVLKGMVTQQPVKPDTTLLQLQRQIEQLQLELDSLKVQPQE